ncbi:MAG TPA: polysaccharide biosynthesis protein, partial [Cyclobacteriaceae bacterium]|nr:polysaccharide biosynthesis protein [Cyclobacteriaceae bacterium]
EVLYPSTSVFEGKNNFKTYISNSGGFTDEARRKRSYVVYPSGKVDRTNNLIFANKYPRITPGAEIYVPAKPERDRMGAQGWIGIATSLATLGILLNSLIQ